MANENQRAIDAIEECFRRKGDPASLERFNNALEGHVKAILATISGGDRDLVHDAYGDVFIKYITLFRQGKKAGKAYRPEYFVAMAKNCLIDALRKKKKTVSIDSLFAETLPRYNPKTACDEENKIALQMALLKLPPRDRYILEKHYIEGMTDEELAINIGVSPSSIPMLIKRAKEKLKKIVMGC